MKDYERLYRACVILAARVPATDYNLHAEHDTVFLCFDVSPSRLTAAETEELHELRIHYHSDVGAWQMECSS